MLQEPFESLEALLPEVGALGKPPLGNFEALRLQPAVPDAAALFGSHDPAALEDGEVFHHRRHRHRERLSEFADGSLALRELFRDLTPHGVGEGSEDLIKFWVKTVNQ